MLAHLLNLGFAIFLIAGCAVSTSASTPFDVNANHWQGRLSVRVASTPVQSFSANFELRGVPEVGTMGLTTPLGTTLARMDWGKHGVQLEANGGTQSFASLEDITLSTMGAELPVAALFQWLRGSPTESNGWHVDLNDFESGRIIAKRVRPEPMVELKIILER